MNQSRFIQVAAIGGAAVLAAMWVGRLDSLAGPFWFARAQNDAYNHLLNALGWWHGQPLHSLAFHPGVGLSLATVVGLAPFNRLPASVILATPEFYLDQLLHSLWALLVIASLLLLFFLVRRGRFALAAIISSAPLVMPELAQSVARYSAESWLILCCVPLVALSLKLSSTRALLRGGLIAVGVSTKLTFLPLLVHAVAIETSWRRRLATLISCLFVFLLLLYPLFEELPQTLHFWREVTIGSLRQNQGSLTIWGITLLQRNPLVLLLLGTWLWQYRQGSSNRWADSWGLAAIAQLALCALKPTETYYAVPALVCSLLAGGELLVQRLRSVSVRSGWAFATGIAILIAWQSYRLDWSERNWSASRLHLLAQAAGEPAAAPLYVCNSAPSKTLALLKANYVAQSFTQNLNALYANTYFCDVALRRLGSGFSHSSSSPRSLAGASILAPANQELRLSQLFGEAVGVTYSNPEIALYSLPQRKVVD